MKEITIKASNIYMNDDLKDMDHIVIHTPNDEYMIQFLILLKELLEHYEYKNLEEIDKVKYFYINYTDDLYNDCDWYEMPEYKINEDLKKSPSITLYYSKSNNNFLKDLYDKLKITTKNNRYLWFPYRIDYNENNGSKLIYECSNEKLKYPIYIISKGRWERRYTCKYLEFCNIEYKIVIEPQEYDEYSKVIDKSKIIVLPDKYLNKNRGSIPARNFVLEHSRKNGDKRHWILDDNIINYVRLNNSKRILIKGSSVFKVIEDYVDRYENIKMAGHNYRMFGVPTNLRLKPITKNTRIYSSILLSNDIPFKWRGKYNEDTDLSLRILKKKYPTILFNCILADKQKTLQQKGGNTDTIYNVKDALLLKAKSLQKQHPDVAKIIEKFGRTHHYVDYTPFKTNKTIFKKEIEEKLKKDTINNFNIILKEKAKESK